MILAFEGISGSGKSTLIMRLKEFFKNQNYKVFCYHFYSDIKDYAPQLSVKFNRIESKFYNQHTPIEEKIKYFKQFCELGIEAFKQNDWNENNSIYLFDRTPLTYLAYVNGGLEKPVEFSDEFHSTVKLMKPIILNIDITEAHHRNSKRKKQNPHEILHNQDFSFTSRVQEKYLNLKNSPYFLEIYSSNEFYEKISNSINPIF